MPKIRIKFDTDIEEINRQIFEFESYYSIRQVLQSFLNKTKSKNNINLDKIQFIYKGKRLNSPQFLDQKASEMFKFQNHNLI